MTEDKKPAAQPTLLTSRLRTILKWVEFAWVAAAIAILVPTLSRLGEPNTWIWLVIADCLLAVAGLFELARRRLPRDDAQPAPKTNGQ